MKYVRHGNTDRVTPFPPEVAWVTPAMAVKANRRRGVSYITAEEARRLVEAATGLRDKAMIALEFEAGLRPTEFLGIRVGDVRFDGDAAYLSVRGKTGPRVVGLFSSVSLVSRWLEVHPARDNPEAPLWVVQSNYRRGMPVGYAVWLKRLRQTAVKAGVKKRVTLYAFRHGAATETAKYLTEPEQRIRYGWSPRSTVPSVYTHLNADDVNRKLAKVMAGKPLEVKPGFAAVKCTRCAAENTPGTNYCARCGTPLSPGELAKRSVEIEELRKLVADLRQQTLAYLKGAQPARNRAAKST